jgi:putative sterol carrier protein
MVDKALKEKLNEKIEEGEFGVADLPEYLTLFCQVCNESDDVQDEVKGFNKTYQFKLDGAPSFWLKVEGGRFTGGQGDPEKADVILKTAAAVGAKVFTGEKDATSTYQSGALKIEGQLPDAVKLRTLIELVREEIE